MGDSNSRVPGWKPGVLTSSPMGQMAPNTGLEPVTTCLTGNRSNQTELIGPTLTTLSILILFTNFCGSMFKNSKKDRNNLNN